MADERRTENLGKDKSVDNSNNGLFSNTKESKKNEKEEKDNYSWTRNLFKRGAFRD